MEILDEEIEINESPKEDEWRSFIGDKADHYIPIWNKFEKEDKRVHFNLSAMFFNIYWLCYRKMYKLALGFFLLTLTFLGFIIINLENIHGDNFMFYIFMYYFIYIGLALWGDWMYYNHAQKIIQEIKHNIPNPTERSKAIKAAGGTDAKTLVVLLIVVAIISFTVPFLFKIS